MARCHGIVPAAAPAPPGGRCAACSATPAGALTAPCNPPPAGPSWGRSGSRECDPTPLLAVHSRPGRPRRGLTGRFGPEKTPSCRPAAPTAPGTSFRPQNPAERRRRPECLTLELSLGVSPGRNGASMPRWGCALLGSAALEPARPTTMATQENLRMVHMLTSCAHETGVEDVLG
eukprot:scaffold1610_cov257-Pinguiococcus_pyrenoidosus.AAC.11